MMDEMSNDEQSRLGNGFWEMLDKFDDIVRDIRSEEIHPGLTEDASNFLAENLPGVYFLLSREEKAKYIRSFNHFATPRVINPGEM